MSGYTSDRIAELIREIKLNIVLGVIKPNSNLLTKRELSYIKNLKGINVIITGSIVLKLFGLIDREIHDCDIIIDIDEELQNGNITIDQINTYSRSSSYIMGAGETRGELIIDEFKKMNLIKKILNFLKRSRLKHKYDIIPCEYDHIPYFSYNGMKFSNIEEVIIAKLEKHYRYKDFEDFQHIEQVLSVLPKK